MTNGPDDVAVLAADLAALIRAEADLEAVHFTTRGYDRLIADTAVVARAHWNTRAHT